MEDPRLVRLGDIGDFGQSRVGPDTELVVRDPVRREEFPRVGVEDERGDLGRGDEGIQARRGGRVPEVDRAVRGTAA